MYEPHIQAFSPHISRGSADQQNSQPVNCDKLSERGLWISAAACTCTIPSALIWLPTPTSPNTNGTTCTPQWTHSLPGGKHHDDPSRRDHPCPPSAVRPRHRADTSRLPPSSLPLAHRPMRREDLALATGLSSRRTLLHRSRRQAEKHHNETRGLLNQTP